MIMPDLKLVIVTSAAKGMPLWRVDSKALRCPLVQNIGRESLAKRIVQDLGNNMVDTLKAIHVLQTNRGNPRLTAMGYGLKTLLQAQSKIPSGTQTGRFSTKNPQALNLANCRTAMQPQVSAAKDPKTEAFINVSKELGYEIHDLHEMDESLKEKIADVVDYEFDKVRTSGDHQVGQPMKQPTPYGNPVIASETEEDEPESVELDRWDLMAGHTKTRDPWGDKKEKKPYEPDEIDPNIDPMEEIRRVGGRAGH